MHCPVFFVPIMLDHSGYKIYHILNSPTVAAAEDTMATQPSDDWIEWDGNAASIPSAIGWVQFSHETREQAESRLKTQVDYWPWYGDDEKPCIVAYKLEGQPA